MAERAIKKLKVGELVEWFESYADGFMIKDVGHGIILDVNAYELGFSDGPHINYTVYRNKHNDTMRFTKEELKVLESE
jgi:hypothetical protein